MVTQHSAVVRGQQHSVYHTLLQSGWQPADGTDPFVLAKIPHPRLGWVWLDYLPSQKMWFLDKLNITCITLEEVLAAWVVWKLEHDR